MVVPPESTTCVLIFAEVNVTLLDVQERSAEDSAGELAGTTLSRNKKRSAPTKTMFSSDVLISPLEHGRQPDDKTKKVQILADVHVTLYPEGIVVESAGISAPAGGCQLVFCPQFIFGTCPSFLV